MGTFLLGANTPIHKEDGVTYLLYAVGGEAGVAIAQVDF
jgi:hypothetical protein